MDLKKTIKGVSRRLKKTVMQLKHRFNEANSYSLFYLSREGEQAALYSKIKSYNYFDPSWYALAYKNEIEFPHDLLLDYVKAGIQKRRDPSPYFNTILYRREHDVPPERALLHYLRNGQLSASGAYRDEQALLSAQRIFTEKTETLLVHDHRTSTKPFAIYLQCGSGSVWQGQLPGQDQPWHLLINHYDATHAGKIPCDVELRQAGALPGTKFTSFHSLLQKYHYILDPYEYILLLDDDVLFDAGDISLLFSLIHQHGWEMAQASLSPDSHSSFPVFINPGKSGWRKVNGVELMMPVFSTRILGTVNELMAQSISGWGFDAALSVMASRHGLRAAVVDKIIARHIKPVNADIGPYYQMLHRARIYPEIEFTHLQKKYGFTKPIFYEI